MPDNANLPYLIRLLEDDSEVVRESVLNELSSFGPFLEIELSRSNITASADQRNRIRNLLGEHSRRWLAGQWTSVGTTPEGNPRLEHAAALIAEFQYGPGYPVKLSPLLDKVASDYRKREPDPSVLSLASYLFKTRKLRGAEKDYYNPFHSNLVYVLEEGRGNPLSLSCVYILVGHRLGLDVEGCNFPGHFLTRARNGNETYIVDCFNGGRFLERSDILSMNKGSSAQLDTLLDDSCSADVILARMLRNLIQAYTSEDKQEHRRLFQGLLHSMHAGDQSEQDNEL